MASLWFLVLRLGLCVYLMLIIVLTGLLMNFLCLILFVTTRPFSVQMYRHLAIPLIYTFEIDWVLSMIMMDKFHGLGYSKGIVEDSLKYFPAIGWTFFFSECIFVKKNTIRDKQIL